jgi:transposase-like protein
VCKLCNHKYTLNGKIREYPEEVQKKAIQAYYSGVSGRGVGKLMGIGKYTVYEWIKKNG